MSPSMRTYSMRVFGVRNLGYVYSVRAATKSEAKELAKQCYRAETGDVVLRVEEVKTAPLGEKVKKPKKS